MVKYFSKLLFTIAQRYKWKKQYKLFKALTHINPIKDPSGKILDNRTFLILPYLRNSPARRIYGSQCFQAFFVSEIVYPEMKNGIFLDIGANDPIHINNTYYLEKLGWTGLAFEPMPEVAKKWSDSGRKTPCLPVCLGSRDGEVIFDEYEDSYLSCIRGNSQHSGDSKLLNSYTVPCRRLSGILLEHNIDHVDFMSLDVEGSELSVLEGIDFDAVSIGVIILENVGAFDQTLPLRIYLLDKGFKYAARLWHDDVFVSSEIYQRLWKG